MKTQNMSCQNLKLLSCLRENSRDKLTSISKKTHIPTSTLFDILRALQSSVITKQTILIDFAKLGFHSRAQIFIKVSPENKDQLTKHLMCNHSINNIYKVNNGWDFIIETVHKNIKELDSFLDSLNTRFKIEQQQIHYLIDDVKREGFMVN